MGRSFRLSCAGLLVPLFAMACTPVVIAPPPLPPPTIPSLPGDGHADATTPPAAGFTRVWLTTDVPARVYLHADAVGGGTGRRGGPHVIKTLVCETTPCAFVVAYGDHEIDVEGSESAAVNELGEHQSYANRTATAVVHAHAPEVVLNQTLGMESSPPARAFGGCLIGIGVVLAIGAGAATKGQSSQNRDTAVGLLVGGASSLALGSIILAAAPSIEQPAATREWTPKQGATAGGSIGFRF